MKFEQGQRMLVIAPHADDAEMGCGGTMLRAAQAGVQLIALCLVTKPERQLHVGLVDEQTRYDEFERATRALTVDSAHVLYRRQDEDFDLCNVAFPQLVSQLDHYIKAYSPSIVLLPVPSFHQDHQRAFDAGMAACRPTRYPSPIRAVYAYEYPAAIWGPSSSWDQARGATYVNITQQLESKMRALAEHKSQMYRGADALISLEAVRGQARMRGIESGVPAAEKLYLLRETL